MTTERVVRGRYYTNAKQDRIVLITAVNADGKETDEAREWDTSAFIGEHDPFRHAHVGTWFGAVRITDAVVYLEGKKVVSINACPGSTLAAAAEPSTYPLLTPPPKDVEFKPPDGFALVWRAHPVTTIEDTRWVWASYDTVAGVTIAWRCPDPGRSEGWREIDLDPVTWIPDPAPDHENRRQKCLLLSTRGGRVVGIAIQTRQRAG